jgi:simple sugar transport system permease protein
MAAFWVGTRFESLPALALLLLIIIGAWIAGGIWGAIPGFLKARYGVNEIIVTVMMNFIILLVLSYLLSSAWQDPKSYFYQTAQMPEATYFPKLFAKGRLHLGFVLALITAVFVYVLLWKTTLGYEIRAIGINPLAARYKGIDVARTTVVLMAISGAIAAMGGASEVCGVHHRLRLDISIGYGFTGIIIALLGRLHPVGVVLAAIFFGALVNGALAMQITTGVPVALVSAIQGITLICLLAADVLPRYRLTPVRSPAGVEATHTLTGTGASPGEGGGLDV